MITKELFEQIALQYGCGYWHVCDDHACGCSQSSAVGQGFSPEVYASMAWKNDLVAEEHELEEDEDMEEDDYFPLNEKCQECGAQLLGNAAGDKWCPSDTCGYFAICVKRGIRKMDMPIVLDPYIKSENKNELVVRVPGSGMGSK